MSNASSGKATLFTDLGLLLLRLGFGGGMLYFHGLGKLKGFSAMKDSFPDPIGLGSTASLAGAIGAEVGCAALLVLGLGTRLAAIPLLLTMAVAFFVVHKDDPMRVKELAAAYGVVYLALLCTGAGQFSLDAVLSKRRKG